VRLRVKLEEIRYLESARVVSEGPHVLDLVRPESGKALDRGTRVPEDKAERQTKRHRAWRRQMKKGLNLTRLERSFREAGKELLELSVAGLVKGGTGRVSVVEEHAAHELNGLDGNGH
jgi:hypothetical protein